MCIIYNIHKVNHRRDSETSRETYKSVSIWLTLVIIINVYKHPISDGRSIYLKKYNWVVRKWAYALHRQIFLLIVTHTVLCCVGHYKNVILIKKGDHDTNYWHTNLFKAIINLWTYMKNVFHVYLDYDPWLEKMLLIGNWLSISFF